MRATFADAKQIALAALFDALYHDADYVSLQVNAIHARTLGAFSKGYLRRVLAALASDGLVEISSEENSDDYFTLSDAGIVAAEKLPSAELLAARFVIEGAPDQAIPASDRIVTLSHNQVAEAEAPVTGLLDALEQDNGNPEEPGARERLIGQIKAGMELIRSGQFRAYLLYEVLVKALGELIDRYGNPTIAELARALLGAVVSQMLVNQ